VHRRYFSYHLIIICLFSAFNFSLLAQTDLEQSGALSIDEILDQLFTEDEDLNDSSFADLYENLNFYISNPININNADTDFFKSTGLLNDLQITAFLNYKAQYGDFIALEELQVVEGFNAEIIQRLLPFIKSNNENDFQRSIPHMIANGSSTLYAKYITVLEDQAGFDEEATNGFRGSKGKYTLRYRYQYENRMRIGFLAEKDQGETFFGDDTPLGFDYYSAHFHLRDYRSWLKDLVIGDYTISLGQGLVMHNDFGAGKTTRISNIKRGGRTVRPYNSVAENNNFRGIAMSLRPSKKIEISPFLSFSKRDATIQIDSSGDSGEPLEFFSSLLESGFHRTENEIAQKDQIEQSVAGLYLKYTGKRFKLGAYSTYFGLNRPLTRSDQLYNQFRFSGEQVWYNGLDYSFRLNNFNFFGEFSLADNGSYSYVNGVLIAMSPKVSVSILHRDYDRAFPTLRSNAFGESTEANNEKGIYTGIEIRPNFNWTISSYLDIFTFPWLRFRVDRPSSGYDFLARIQYTKKRSYSIYLQYNHEKKELNFTDDDLPINPVLGTYRNRLRLNANYNINKNLELRNRVEFTSFRHGPDTSTGFMVYQDVIYKPVGLPLSFTARYALYDTDDFDSRIFAYENDILYEFFIPAYFYKGTRAYLNVRYNVTYNMMIEFRISRTYLANRETIGSGLNEIDGNKRTDFKMQAKFKF
jgi:hypothetical protein